MQQSEPKQFGFCVMELMGHRRVVGDVREEMVGGVMLLRVDVPQADNLTEILATQYYGAQSLYCLTPVSEEVARLALRREAHPIARLGLPVPETQVIYDSEYGGSDDYEPDDSGEDWGDAEVEDDDDYPN